MNYQFMISFTLLLPHALKDRSYCVNYGTTVFAPKYRGKILIGDVAMITEGIICKTCKELGIEIIEIAVNPDHVHIFFKYPPKYSLSFIAKRLKGRTSRILRKEFPHLKEWCGEHMWAPSCFHGSVGNGWDVVSS